MYYIIIYIYNYIYIYIYRVLPSLTARERTRRWTIVIRLGYTSQFVSSECKLKRTAFIYTHVQIHTHTLVNMHTHMLTRTCTHSVTHTTPHTQ